MAKILYGKPVADELKIKFLKEKEFWLLKGIAPQICIVRVGDKKDDIAYETRIEKNCLELGVRLRKIVVDNNITTVNLAFILNELNNDVMTHGILIFRPLPEAIDINILRTSISSNKDIDSMSLINSEMVFSGNNKALEPCTPLAVIEILKFYEYELAGSKVGIINRSLVLGKPLAMMLLQNQATVSIGHSKTKNLKEFTNNHDIIVTGIGKAKFFNKEYFNESNTIIDVGINFNEHGLCGDIDYESVLDNVMAITPVPGGVGAVTSMMLFMNLLKAIKLQFS
jgi:methylenetetrahydrofolate dehydrogenase (NADP+)/methenyltetrahydrofolate cyclohydrolase